MISIRDNAQTLDSRDYLLLDSTDEYVDLYHLAELVKVGISDTTVQSMTQEVMDAVVAVSTLKHPDMMVVQKQQKVDFQNDGFCGCR